VVKEGDTAWEIARGAGLKMSDLARFNPGKDFDLIHPGDVISLGSGPEPEPEPEPGPQLVTAEQPGDIKVLIDGKEAAIAVEIIGGRVYVPVRAVGEAVGAGVEYDPSKRVVRITSPRGG
jgi:LysM repeat protein